MREGLVSAIRGDESAWLWIDDEEKLWLLLLLPRWFWLLSTWAASLSLFKIFIKSLAIFFRCDLLEWTRAVGGSW